MNIKRFFAPDTRQAMQQVRKTLGADAVIISNRQTEDGVEIIAALDLDSEQLVAASQQQASPAGRPAREAARPSARPAAKTGIAASAKTPAPATASPATPVASGQTANGGSSDGTIERMNEEINRLRSMLENQITSMNVGQWTKNSPTRIKLYNQLTRMGLESNLATSLISNVTDEEDQAAASRKVLSLLTQQIRISERDVVHEGGIVVLLGTSGSGKTTTLAKIAAQFIMENSTRDAVFISADNTRVGAHEQLQAYGRLFGIPVLRARDEVELEEIIAATADKRLVLVDAGSLSPLQQRQPDRIATLNFTNMPIRHFLVVPATVQGATMNRLMTQFRQFGIDGAILSKLDEASNMGEALTTVIRTQMPMAYFTDGQRVTAHLHRASGRDLVSRALQMVREQEVSVRSEAITNKPAYRAEPTGFGY